jgi:hypothetical protein
MQSYDRSERTYTQTSKTPTPAKRCTLIQYGELSKKFAIRVPSKYTMPQLLELACKKFQENKIETIRILIGGNYAKVTDTNVIRNGDDLYAFTESEEQQFL